MEKMQGIMIATTNLTGSLDSAFERRFLYKIEFEKPTPNESRHIWKSMPSTKHASQRVLVKTRQCASVSNSPNSQAKLSKCDNFAPFNLIF